MSDVKFHSKRHRATTEHPASSYGLGVILRGKSGEILDGRSFVALVKHFDAWIEVDSDRTKKRVENALVTLLAGLNDRIRVVTGDPPPGGRIARGMFDLGEIPIGVPPAACWRLLSVGLRPSHPVAGVSPAPSAAALAPPPPPLSPVKGGQILPATERVFLCLLSPVPRRGMCAPRFRTWGI